MGKNETELPCEIASPHRQWEKENIPVREKKKVPLKKMAKNQESECQGRGQNPQGGGCVQRPGVRMEQERPALRRQWARSH